jgi:hypothetical protein
MNERRSILIRKVLEGRLCMDTNGLTDAQKAENALEIAARIKTYFAETPADEVVRRSEAIRNIPPSGPETESPELGIFPEKTSIFLNSSILLRQPK